MGWHLSVYKSNNVEVIDSAFVGAQAIGVHMDNVRNVTFNGNFVGDVLKRDSYNAEKSVDKEACVAICSYMLDGSPCYDLTIKNNIAAGCKFAGFIVPGHDCGKSGGSNSFKDNVSHSNLGVGAAIYPSKFTGKSHNKCYEMSYFSGYKTTLPCLATMYQT